MYSFICLGLLAAGVLLLAFGGRMAKGRRVLDICLKILGLVLLAAALAALYWLLSGRVVLPLFRG